MPNNLQSQIRKDILNLRRYLETNMPLENIPKSGQAITKSDSTTYQKMLGLYVGTSGDLAVVLNEETLTIKNAPVGYHPGEFTKVLSTGTTASDILGFWA